MGQLFVSPAMQAGPAIPGPKAGSRRARLYAGTRSSRNSGRLRLGCGFTGRALTASSRSVGLTFSSSVYKKARTCTAAPG